MAVNFFYNDIGFRLQKANKIKRWIHFIASFYKYTIGEVNIMFCSDDIILDVNKEFLNHNYYTDVITFPYNVDQVINSDIYISIDTVKSNSKEFNQKFKTELYRVIAHAILHLIGFNDATQEEKQIMRDNEESALRMLQSFL